MVRDGLRQANEAGIGGSTTGADALLQIDGLACSYGGIDVLHGVDMHVGAGEAVCLVGSKRRRQDDARQGRHRPRASDGG